MDAASTGSVATTFGSTIAAVRRVSSARVVGCGNTSDPFECSGADHARLDISTEVATVFADVASDGSVRRLIVPVTIHGNAENGFFSESSWLLDDGVGVPSSEGTVELSTTIQGVTAVPECNTEATILLAFGTFLPHPSVLNTLSTNPTVSGELRGEEDVFVEGSDGGEVTLDAEVVVTQALALSNEVGLVGFEELVDVTSGRVVHGVGTGSP